MTLIQLYNVAEAIGARVDEFDLDEEPSVSLERKQGYAIAINKNIVKSQAHERVCLAHELGHCETDSFYNINNYLDVRTKHERRADKWAIINLVSADELFNAVASGYTELWELAEHFDIPEEFMKKIVCYYEGWEW